MAKRRDGYFCSPQEDAFMWAHRDDMSIIGIARALGRSRETVRARLRRMELRGGEFGPAVKLRAVWIETDRGPFKFCAGCGKFRPQIMYYRDKSTYSGFKSRCCRCISRKTKSWKQENGPAWRDYQRNYNHNVYPLKGHSVVGSSGGGTGEGEEVDSRDIVILDLEIALLFGDELSAELLEAVRVEDVA